MKRATNFAVMRDSNRKLIMNMIRMAPISRAELAQKTQLTRASITKIIDALLDEQLVIACDSEGNHDTTPGIYGRRPTLLTIKARSRFVFGVSISRQKCTVGVVDLCGNILDSYEFSLAGLSPDDAADQIATCMMLQQKGLQIPSNLVIGISISAPGPVDYQKGIILNPPNFSHWQNTPICQMIEDRTGFPALLEKDTNARALEEMYFGAAKDISSFILVHIDDGVGSGVVMHNMLHRGAHGLGTEIGHTTICYNGPQCCCGGRGCLETYLAIPVLLRGSQYKNWEQLSRNATETDAARLLDHAAEYLSAALVNVINMYDLEKVILTGEVATYSQPLLDRLNPMVTARVLCQSSLQNNLIVSSQIGTPVRTGSMAMLYDFFQDRK